MSNHDEDFATLFAASEQSRGQQRRLKPGQVVDAKIVAITSHAVLLDLGTRCEGEIAREQLSDQDGNLNVKVGDQVRATVAVAGDRPQLVLSLSGQHSNGREMIELAFRSETPIDGMVSRTVKGGLEVEIGNSRCFCPASQIDIAYTPDISVYEGQTLRFRVLEIRDGGHSVILSRRALLQVERNEVGRERLANLEAGSIVEGTVQSIQSYGAFIDIGGIGGLVHISELSQTRVDQVSDVVQVGESVRVQVLDILPSTDGKSEARIRLSMKSLSQPTQNKERNQEEILEGEVSKVEAFGVFVETEKGIGLIPIRELELPPGGDFRRAYPLGKKVKVVSQGLDNNKRLRLSARQVADAEARINFREFSSVRNDDFEDIGKSGQSGQKIRKSQLGSLGVLLQQKLHNR